MRISKTDTLAGVPLTRVRDLVRRLMFATFGASAVADELGIPPRTARSLVNAMLAAGYIRRAKGKSSRVQWYELTSKASTLASATAALPLRASTAERLLREVVERAREINSSDAYAYRVARIEVFGSVLRGKARPSDVDLAVTLRKRYSDDERQDEAEKARIDAAVRGGRRFPNFVKSLYWPQNEVLQALRAGRRGLSFSSGDTPVRLGAASTVVFDDTDTRAPRPKENRRR